MARGTGPPRVVAETSVAWGRAACRGPHSSRSRGKIARGGDWSCEAETCRARQRLVGGGSSSRELVGDAADKSRALRLAREGLDQGPRSSLS
jgi:hypothetical protein